MPFAVGLELFSSTCQDETDANADPALPQLPESEGLLSLQYVLDGRAQVCCSAISNDVFPFITSMLPLWPHAASLASRVGQAHHWAASQDRELSKRL